MLVVPYVCAEFHDKSGEVIHRIHAHELRTITEVPEAVQQDPLFALLVMDELLKAPDSKLDLLALENDPDAKLTKPEKPAKAAKTAKADKTPKAEKPEKAETESSSAAPAEAAASDGIQVGTKA